MDTLTRTEQIRPVGRLEPWGLVHRVAFRFCFLYFGLYCLTTQIITSFVPLPNVDVPDPSTLWPVRPLVSWVAAHFFHIKTPLVYTGSGSGDKTFDWVLVFCSLLLAAIVTTVWSLLDRKRENYVTMAKWFRLFLRFALAGQMMVYGMAKAVPLQMPFPYLTRLLEHYGDFSPMGVLWSAVGASPAYQMFTGCAELLGGVLLIFPRTTMFGALICLADMIQVFMLNMTYDVPVKLLSFHLILLSLFLLSRDLPRLIRFFFLNRAVEPSSAPALFATPRANRIALLAQILLGLWLIGMNAYGSRESWHTYGGGRPLSPLYGIWDVDQLSIDGQPRPLLLNDKESWRRVIFDAPGRVIFQRTDESFAGYGATIQRNENKLILTKGNDKTWIGHLAFQRTGQDRLSLDGDMGNQKIQLQLRLFDLKKFQLMRSFHWIQEYPFNR